MHALNLSAITAVQEIKNADTLSKRKNSNLFSIQVGLYN